MVVDLTHAAHVAANVLACAARVTPDALRAHLTACGYTSPRMADGSKEPKVEFWRRAEEPFHVAVPLRPELNVASYAASVVDALKEARGERDADGYRATTFRWLVDLVALTPRQAEVGGTVRDSDPTATSERAALRVLQEFDSTGRLNARTIKAPRARVAELGRNPADDGKVHSIFRGNPEYEALQRETDAIHSVANGIIEGLGERGAVDLAWEVLANVSAHVSGILMSVGRVDEGLAPVRGLRLAGEKMMEPLRAAMDAALGTDSEEET